MVPDESPSVERGVAGLVPNVGRWASESEFMLSGRLAARMGFWFGAPLRLF